jgi:tetratricopeptide (TPR) repeat protein
LAATLLLGACGGQPADPSASAANPSATQTTGQPGTSASPTPGATHVAGGGAGGIDGMAAFSDSRSFTESTWRMLAPVLKAQACTVTAREPEQLSREEALDRARKFLADAVGEPAMRAFESSPEASSADAAKTAAAAAAITGNDAGALAAMLSAIGHEPDNPRHLVNAAALMPAFGLGSEALALLDAADGMAAPDSTPYGLDPQAVAQTNRGRALISLGQWDEAASVLEGALATDGALLEAADNLSLALLCQGKDDEAMNVARSNRHREKPRTTERDGTTTPKPEDVFEMSLGVDESPLLPNLHIPSSPGEGVALRDQITEIKQDLVDRTIERAQQQTQLQGQLNAAGLHQMTVQRNGEIMAAIAAVSASEGPAADAWTDVVEASNAAFDAWDAFWGPSGEVESISNDCSSSDDYNGCMRTSCIPATEAFHAAWTNHAFALDDLVREWADLYHPIATAIAGHIGNPIQHQLAVLSIQGQLETAFVDVVSQVEMVAMSEDNARETCVEGFAPVPEDYQPVSPGAGEPCRMNTGQWKLKIAFVSLQAECSDWSVEASTPGPLGVFISVSSKGGATTIFAGPSASASVGPFEAGSKSGFYVRSSPSGTTDFGYRVEPGSTSINAGPVQVEGPQMQAMDFSFVGIGAYLPGM